MTGADPTGAAGTAILTPDGSLAPAGALSGAGPLSTAAAGVLDAALRSYAAAPNRLLATSADLVALVALVRRLDDLGTAGPTRAQIARAIIDLKDRVVRLDYPPSVAENLCLLFAIVLDEFVLTSDWGRRSGWENLTLVADLFGFRDGGDRFFQIAERALMQPRALREFLEIQYLLLKLGYRGRYKDGNDHGRDRLIGRLESALQAGAAPGGPAVFGRAPQQTRPPRQRPGLRAQGLVALAVSGGLVLGGLLLHGDHAEAIRARLAAQGAAQAGADRAVYVYSSTTGTTERRGDD